MHGRTAVIAIVVAFLIAIAGAWMQSNKGGRAAEGQRVENLIEALAQGERRELAGMLWQADSMSRPALDLSLKMLEVFRRPTDGDVIEIEKTFTDGDYQLLVLKLSWDIPTSPTSHLPLLVVSDDGGFLVLGLLLPFNDVIPLIPEEQMMEIVSLSTNWVAWIEDRQ